ncbi:putative signal peptide protein [Puccinia sorghi]|uniref:Putative signal peptide protein n=1 Tax=Puccinia sorghi TaxID=27349 RepID=A0A0L6UAY5_9BASI|nr:putative signal peptide protein [Puccinia sorghi]
MPAESPRAGYTLALLLQVLTSAPGLHPTGLHQYLRPDIRPTPQQGPGLLFPTIPGCTGWKPFPFSLKPFIATTSRPCCKDAKQVPGLRGFTVAGLQG